jgi:hypothetical protein
VDDVLVVDDLALAAAALQRGDGLLLQLQALRRVAVLAPGEAAGVAHAAPGLAHRHDLMVGWDAMMMKMA